jgi:RNA polymerase sigma factor (TIGR02999 family)
MLAVTRILERVRQGEAHAAGELLPLVYDELRRLAAARLAQQSAGQTLQATELVHEAWLKLAGHEEAGWNDRRHFFRAAAEAMRQILIDRARAKGRYKRGAGCSPLRLDEVEVAAETEPETLLIVDEALQALAAERPEAAELVKLIFYVGLSAEEAAQALDLSERTAQRRWIHARAWLFREISRSLRA